MSLIAKIALLVTTRFILSLRHQQKRRVLYWRTLIQMYVTMTVTMTSIALCCSNI